MADLLEYGTFALALIGSAAGTAKWVLSRVNRDIERAEQSTGQVRKDLVEHAKEEAMKHEDLHSRINKTRDEYVRREDFDRLTTGLTSQMEQFRMEVREDLKGLASRFDTFFLSVKKD